MDKRIEISRSSKKIPDVLHAIVAFRINGQIELDYRFASRLENSALVLSFESRKSEFTEKIHRFVMIELIRNWP